MNHDLVHYYARRAGEYEQIYEKPERQIDIPRVIDFLKTELAGGHVLEIACGTGYWSHHVSETARSILATDVSREVIEIARSKAYPRPNVTFSIADLRRLPIGARAVDAAFGGFIWSHIPLQALGDFLSELNRCVRPGGKVVLIDNRYVEGSSSPVSRRDADGNTYQARRLLAGSSHEVLKNFPSEENIYAMLAGKARRVTLRRLAYYWLLAYEV